MGCQRLLSSDIMLTGGPEQSLLVSLIPAGEEAFLYLVEIEPIQESAAVSTDDEHFQGLGSKDRPQLPRSLASFIGQTLGNHYQDTFIVPLSDELQRLVDALDMAERDVDAAGT